MHSIRQFGWLSIIAFSSIILVSSYHRGISTSEEISEAISRSSEESPPSLKARSPVQTHELNFPTVTRDAEWIMNLPEPEIRMTFRIMTNRGLSPDRAKGLLPETVGHLYYISACNDFILRTETAESDHLDTIRNDPSYRGVEKDGALNILALSYRQLRDTWIGRKERRLEEFTTFVRNWGLITPEAVVRELLQIQPRQFSLIPTSK